MQRSQSAPIAGQRDLTAFLNALLESESGLQSDRHNWYAAHLDDVVMTYPAVSSPGRALLDTKSGAFILERITVREYFRRLGVDHLFDPLDRGSIRRMQFAAINPLGFVGYQFGESLLTRLGYYIRENPPLNPTSLDLVDRKSITEIEADVPLCATGFTEVRATSASRPSLNTWNGVFTGKNGICNLSDLRTEWAQQLIIVETLRSTMAELFDKLRRSMGDCDSMFPWMVHVKISHKLPKVLVRCTVPGALAAAHLCGTDATVSFLCSGEVTQDEFGTSIADYMAEFSLFSFTL